MTMMMVVLVVMSGIYIFYVIANFQIVYLFHEPERTVNTTLLFVFTGKT